MKTSTEYYPREAHKIELNKISLLKISEESLEKFRWIIAPVAILVFGTLGGIAAGSAEGNLFKLLLVGVSSALTLSLILSLSRVRYIVYALITAAVIDVVIIATYFLS